jgi:hypothetical protein
MSYFFSTATMVTQRAPMLHNTYIASLVTHLMNLIPPSLYVIHPRCVRCTQIRSKGLQVKTQPVLRIY